MRALAVYNLRMKFLFLLLISFPLWAQIDPAATPETKALYQKLNEVSLSINGDL